MDRGEAGAGVLVLADGTELELARWPLPAGVEDGILNRTQVARAFDVSENTITKWLGQGLPLESAGANGQAYEFRLSHCWAWRQARLEASRAARERSDAIAAQAALAFRNLDDDAEGEAEARLTAKDIREWAEAEYRRNQVAEQRRELVRAGRMQGMLEELLVAWRTALSTLPDYAEREFGLTARQVAQLQARCDETLIEARARIERELLAPGEVAEIAPAAVRQAALDV